jgi:large exoprotein involved in heme utilization and adhesion
VTVKAAETIVLSGQNSTILTNAEDRGQGGDISLQARHIQLTAGASISSQSSGTGNAGTIRLAASDTFLSENSAVTAEARRAQGGAIQVMAQTMIRLRQSEITTTVRGGDEMAGSITLDPAFVILEDSQIRADAVGGPGGNITITAEVFLTDPSSIVSASSERNIDGEIDIRAPVADLSGTVAPLPQSFLQQAVLLRERCAERLRRGWTSSFIVSGRDGSPFEPGSMLSSPLSRESQAGTGGLRSTTTPLPESSRCGP